jgi:hypothetical protein
VLVASLAYGAAAGDVSAIVSYQALHMIVPAAGGSVIGRLVAEDLGTALDNRWWSKTAPVRGQHVVQYVIDQPADGYTLLLGTSGNMASNKVLYRNLKFDTEVDLVPTSHDLQHIDRFRDGPIKSVADSSPRRRKSRRCRSARPASVRLVT